MYVENNSKIICHKNGIHWQISILFSVLICLKIAKFATFVFWSFQLKLPYYKSSESVVPENNHVLLKNIWDIFRQFSHQLLDLGLWNFVYTFR